MNFIRKENEKHGFIDKTVKQIGYPYWDKAVSFKKPHVQQSARGASEDSASIFYVPFVRDGEPFVNASLLIKTKETDTSYRFLCDWQYHDKTHGLPTVDTTAERYALFFMMLDNRTFGHTEFNITDTSLFLAAVTTADYKKLGIINVRTPSSGRTSLMWYNEICLDTYVCGDPGGGLYGVCTNGCDYLNCAASSGNPGHCYLVNEVCDGWWEDDGGGGGTGGTGTGGTSGGGSGGNGSGGPSQCPPGGPVARTEQTTDPCLPGWTPVPGGGNTYNPDFGAAVFNNETVSTRDLNRINVWRNNNLDTAGLDSCRMQILNKLINALSSSSLGVFLAKLDNAVGAPSTIDKFKIHFLTRPLSTQNAVTDHATYDPLTKDFEVDISLDSATAQNATDIFIANTLLHEIVHAYMTFIWKKLNLGATQAQMDSLKYDQVFNAYVDTLRIRDSLNPQLANYQSESIQHNYMADHLLGFMANIVKQVANNPSISDRDFWYLAWAGLTRKSIRTWKSHWPNFPTWPPSNPAPVDDSTRGLKYALTLSRIDTLYRQFLTNEEYSLPGAKGRKPVAGGCY